MKKQTIYLIVPLILATIIIVYFILSSEPPEKITQNDNYVTRVIDGDTFELYSGDKVRLICIDAPELSEEKGEESKLYLESLILNKEVTLEKDTNDKDQYNRLLRYVFVNETFVNKEMVKNNHAEIFRYKEDTKRCDEIENAKI